VKHFARVLLVAEQTPGPPEHEVPVTAIEPIDRRGVHVGIGQGATRFPAVGTTPATTGGNWTDDENTIAPCAHVPAAAPDT
jgi:hypothetical protein